MRHWVADAAKGLLCLIVVMHQGSKTRTWTFVHAIAGHRAYSACGKCL